RSLPCIPTGSFSSSLHVGERGGTRPRRDQRRPLFRAERDGWRKKRPHAALLVFRDDGGACVAPHQLVVHQAIMPKNSAPTVRSEMIRVSDVSISSGVVVNEIVSISSSRSLIASGPKYCASTLNRMLFCRAT